MSERPLIEPLRPDDWETVRGIYLEGISTGHATFETQAPAWEKWDGDWSGVVLSIPMPAS